MVYFSSRCVDPLYIGNLYIIIGLWIWPAAWLTWAVGQARAGRRRRARTDDGQRSMSSAYGRGNAVTWSVCLDPRSRTVFLVLACSAWLRYSLKQCFSTFLSKAHVSKSGPPGIPFLRVKPPPPLVLKFPISKQYQSVCTFEYRTYIAVCLRRISVIVNNGQ